MSIKTQCVAGLLDLLLAAAEQRNAAASCNALFALRNLALAGENKAHFVANPRALPVLVAAACRAGQNTQAGAFAAAALWALVHQGEKVDQPFHIQAAALCINCGVTFDIGVVAVANALETVSALETMGLHGCTCVICKNLTAVTYALHPSIWSQCSNTCLHRGCITLCLDVQRVASLLSTDTAAFSEGPQARSCWHGLCSTV